MPRKKDGPESVEPPGRRETQRARRLGRAAAKLARRAAALDRAEEQRLKNLESLALVRQAVAGTAAPSILRSRRGLLIVNSKSGPNRDSLLRVRELVSLLAAYGVRADVRVKLSKSQ